MGSKSKTELVTCTFERKIDLSIFFFVRIKWRIRSKVCTYMYAEKATKKIANNRPNKMTMNKVVLAVSILLEKYENTSVTAAQDLARWKNFRKSLPKDQTVGSKVRRTRGRGNFDPNLAHKWISMDHQMVFGRRFLLHVFLSHHHDSLNGATY